MTQGIGLVGCGWVASMQLAAYREAGFRVVALTDHTPAKAQRLRDELFADATVHPDVEALLADDAVTVVDVATHSAGRPAVVEQALRAGRHVLSQKPFVEDLDEGERLCDLADRHGVRARRERQRAVGAPLRGAARRGGLRSGRHGDQRRLLGLLAA